MGRADSAFRSLVHRPGGLFSSLRAADILPRFQQPLPRFLNLSLCGAHFGLRRLSRLLRQKVAGEHFLFAFQCLLCLPHAGLGLLHPRLVLSLIQLRLFQLGAGNQLTLKQALRPLQNDGVRLKFGLRFKQFRLCFGYFGLCRLQRSL